LADTEIQQLCARIIDQLSANHSVGLTFVLVDGDPGYQAVFDRQFEWLFASNSLVPDLGPVLQATQECPSRQIGDFLRFLKNSRRRIDQKIVHCDCNPQGPGTSVTELSRIFGAMRFLTDFSPIGQVRDSYPLSLFTLQNPLFASTDSEPDLFLYLLIHAIWEKSLLNQELSMSMRLFMLQMVSYFMYEIHFTIQQLKEQRTLRVTEKKTALSSDVTFATLSKLRRMILTVLGQIYAISFFPSRLGLDRIGSHIEENYIGILRQRCCSNNQAETVFRAVARLEFVKSRLPLLGYRAQLSSRANLGGVRIT
jgi:hypothetical protein